MVLKEYRICMPISVEEYRRGQIYMIGRHSEEQSAAGDGVETVVNEVIHDAVHGEGRKTVKNIHINNKLPPFIKAISPTVCIVETAYNYYPYTTTEYTCNWVANFKIRIETRYENNNGQNKDFSKSDISKELPEAYADRPIVHLDLVKDKVADKHYKVEEDPSKFLSKKTRRGRLQPDWKDTSTPIMCSYKLVLVQFPVWGLQTKVENYIHGFIRETLLLAHRQAVCWIDAWFDLTIEEIRSYEASIQTKTNSKVTAGGVTEKQ